MARQNIKKFESAPSNNHAKNSTLFYRNIADMQSNNHQQPINTPIQNNIQKLMNGPTLIKPSLYDVAPNTSKMLLDGKYKMEFKQHA